MIKINNIDKKCKIIRGGVENKRWRGEGGSANVNFRRVLKNERMCTFVRVTKKISSKNITRILFFVCIFIPVV